MHARQQQNLRKAKIIAGKMERGTIQKRKIHFNTSERKSSYKMIRL